MIAEIFVGNPVIKLKVLEEMKFFKIYKNNPSPYQPYPLSFANNFNIIMRIKVRLEFSSLENPTVIILLN